MCKERSMLEKFMEGIVQGVLYGIGISFVVILAFVILAILIRALRG